MLVAINQPFTLWLLYSFFKTVPKELDESALIDGCSYFQAFRHIIMPVMWPGVITAGLFSLMLAYNDFTVTALLLNQENHTMVPKIQSYLGTRDGVLEVINYAKKNKKKLGFVSSTSINNINCIFNSLRDFINKKDFDFIGNNEMVLREKPYPDIYNYSLKYLNIMPEECIAIEDTEESLNSAIEANIKCIAFPGKYHTDNKFNGCHKLVNKLSNEIFN